MSEFRNEIKYLVSEGQLALIGSRISGLMKKDTHTDSGGTYTVRSLYFDDYYDKCYAENINGTEPREKFRIRIYNGDKSYISLECKRKEHGLTKKTACPLTEEQCRALMRGASPPITSDAPPVLCKLITEMQVHLLRPKIIVEYERTPFVCAMGNVRVTFDRNISSSGDIGNFLSREISKRPIMQTGEHILEVKWDEFIPDEIFSALAIENPERTSFSKYALCRKYSER